MMSESEIKENISKREEHLGKILNQLENSFKDKSELEGIDENLRILYQKIVE